MTLQPYLPRDLIVLIVEANTDDARMTSRALEILGVRDCYVVTSGEAALTWLDANPCDILLFDTLLPRMSGRQLLQRVRAATPGAQPIAMSASNDAKAAVALLKLGAIDYIVKDDYFTANMARSVQSAARSKVAQEKRDSERKLASGGSSLEVASAEAAWLLKMFRSRYGSSIPYPSEREDDRWPDAVEAFREYLDSSLRVFPEIVARTEDSLVRLLTERGLSPRDVVNLYQIALMAVKNGPMEQGMIRVHPGLLLTRVLSRLLEEYQRSVSLDWNRPAA